MEQLSGVAVERERMSRRCWNKFGSESIFALYSPFFISLTAGTLAPEDLCHFISQDLHFQQAVFDAYVSVEKCVDDVWEKMFIQHLMTSVLQIIYTSNIIVQEMAFQFPKQNTSEVTTFNYTEFLLETAFGKVEGNQVPCKRKIAAFTLGAIVPRMRLYSLLFHQIQNFLDPSHAAYIYNKWIGHYFSLDFKVSVSQTEYALDKLSHCLTAYEVEVMEKLYYRALKFQVECFAKLPTYKKTLVPLFRLEDLSKQLTIFCDYNMTCTIAESAVFLPELSMGLCEFYGISSARLRTIWGALSYLCSMEFEQCLNRIESSVQAQQVFNYNGLVKVLEQVAECEMRANERVSGLRLLQSLSLDNIEFAANAVILQKGCKRFFQKIAENKGPKMNVHVISYCWCGDLIRSVLSPEISIFNVHSNELLYEHALTTGDIWRRVETSFDKSRYFAEVLKCCKSENEHMTVYIGGDIGDLLCLLEADMGIVVNSSSNLMRLGHHFGVKFVPLLPALMKEQKDITKGCSRNWKSQAGVLYTVSCWAEIQAFILGL